MKSTIYLLALLLNCIVITQPLQAASINSENTGQLLIYPYYTVNNGLNTLLSVVNTTDQVKAVKVRFREGKNAQIVMHLNVYLSPYDVWTAALSATDEGATINTVDTSCNLYMDNTDQSWSLDFVSTGFTNDAASNDEPREREGYFEILEMGTVTDSTLAAAATHSNGQPQDCSALQTAWTDGAWNNDAAFGMGPATGGLTGNGIIIDVDNGTAVSYSALAIDGFYAAQTFNNTPPTDAENPSFIDAEPKSILIHDNAAIMSDWNNGVEAISALLMAQQFSNEYTLLSGINARTEYVVTLPTKHHYVNANNTATPPFTKQFSADGACERTNDFHYFDREEDTDQQTGGVMGTPQPHLDLCWSANVINIYNSGAGQMQQDTSPILGSENVFNINVNPFFAGWMYFNFSEAVPVNDTNNSHQYHGYPITGFALQSYVNTAAQPGVLAQYATIFQHTYKRQIQSNTP